LLENSYNFDLICTFPSTQVVFIIFLYFSYFSQRVHIAGVQHDISLILISDTSREDLVSQMATRETEVLGLRSWRNMVKDVKQNSQPTEKKMHTEVTLYRRHDMFVIVARTCNTHRV
jgi:hypothetical protein